MAKPTDIPRWADTVAGDPAKVNEPPNAKKDVGWVTAEKPPAQWLNWLAFTLYTWIVWLRDFEITAHVWTALQTLNFGIVVTQGTANSDGTTSTGNGTGAGVRGRGGASGPGVRGIAGTGATTAPGVLGQGDTSGLAGGPGVRGEGGTDSPGGAFVGNGTAAGLTATGGATNGPGTVSAGTGSGEGVRGTGGATNGIGVVAIGTGTGSGLTATGGATGKGAVIAGGAGALGLDVIAGSAASGARIVNNDAAAATLVVNNTGAGPSVLADSDITTTANVSGVNVIASTSLFAGRDAAGTTLPTPALAVGEHTKGDALHCVVFWTFDGVAWQPNFKRGRGVFAIDRITDGDLWITWQVIPANLSEAQGMAAWSNDNQTGATRYSHVSTLDNNGTGGRLRTRVESYNAGVLSPDQTSTFVLPY